MKVNNIISKLKLPKDVQDLLLNCNKLNFASNKEELFNLSIKNESNGIHEVAFDIPEKGKIKEAYVCKVKNGISVNYYDPYMRRREPDCMFIGDNQHTDKVKFSDRHKYKFSKLRKETYDWLSSQNLAAFCFKAGNLDIGVNGLAIVPDNAGFFALSLALLQGIEDIRKIKEPLPINCIIYIAPPFRHTHFKGKQVVVHNRLKNMHEIFSYNLYPGPSAKKGVYGALLNFGEKQKWLTAHSSVVQVTTPYDNKVTIMHEGASGGGKSEINEHFHREFDGTILFGENIVTKDKRFLSIPRACNLRPVTDDMTLCYPSFQKDNGKLTVFDAEKAWFIRVDHIKNYGTDPDIESCSIHPKEPLVFINLEAPPNSTALLWEHIEDSPGISCPNPRFIFPRDTVPNIINKPVSIDIRSFGLRTPPTTKENPDYGIVGLFHILPPAIAWLWRLVSPRGYNNPSIVGTNQMESEGVGSYWPFATGKKITQANLLLDQIIKNPNVHYILCPNQHIGAWRVGFMPQWIMREYLARRGGVRFTRDELSISRCKLLGYSLNKLSIEGQVFDKRFLKVEYQADVGFDAYDKGAKKLNGFFKKKLNEFKKKELHPIGKKIINCFFSNGDIKDYSKIINCDNIFIDD